MQDFDNTSGLERNGLKMTRYADGFCAHQFFLGSFQSHHFVPLKGLQSASYYQLSLADTRLDLYESRADALHHVGGCEMDRQVY